MAGVAYLLGEMSINAESVVACEASVDDREAGFRARKLRTRATSRFFTVVR